MVSRVLTVTPSSSANLDRFLSKYRKGGAFFITAGYEQTAGEFPTFDPELTIFCRTLNARPAWEIGENDPDLIGVHAEDDPIVPSDILDPPILRTLERIKRIKMRRKPVSEKPLVNSRSPKPGRNELCTWIRQEIQKMPWAVSNRGVLSYAPNTDTLTILVATWRPSIFIEVELESPNLPGRQDYSRQVGFATQIRRMSVKRLSRHLNRWN